MIQPTDIENRLAFDRIKSLAKRYCSTIGGTDKIESVRFSNNRKRVAADLSLTHEMKSIIMFESSFPQCKYVDIDQFLRRVAAHGSHMTEHEMITLRDGVKTVCMVVGYFDERVKNKYPYLSLLSSKIELFPDIIGDIDRIIDQYGKVKDNASAQLRDIRNEKFNKEREVSKKIDSILRSAISSGIAEDDSKVSIRNGRAVIPVLSANKRKLKGFIHDESATGKTSFIEPEEIVVINNEIKELEYSEKREVVRILTDFTDSVRPNIPFLATNAEFIHAIDFITAKAKIAIDQDAHKPIINKEYGIKIVNGRHPILESALRKDSKKIIPLTLNLDKNSHIIVISGPNAGGKSVCLKTVGLLQYMAQCGFLIPASPNSELSVFESLFIDIGDQQSIDNDLSTYSSHLENMKKILRHSNEQSLVLIDEFGSGTEPSVGGAIAEVILEKLNEKGVFGVITTHYTNLKYYASNSSGVINGAMAFDIHNIIPLYTLETGVPGSSFAFEIARKIGLPNDVIQQAMGKLDTTQISLEKQLREIARDKLYWERKREEIKNNEKRYDHSIEQYQQQYQELKTKRSEIIAKAKQEAEDIVKGANRAVESTIREIKEAQAEKVRTQEVRNSLKEFGKSIDNVRSEDDIEKINQKIEKLRQRDSNKTERSIKKSREAKIEKTDEPKPSRDIVVDDKVRIKGQSVIGSVIAIDKGRATIAFGAITSTIKIDTLEIVSNNEYRKQQKDITPNYYSGAIVTSSSYDVGDKRLNFKSEIDVRGKRVEEIYPIIERLVDEASMFGSKELKVLHGKGTGALKEEIRKYLHTLSNVTSAKDEHVDFGGSGITVITLK